VWDIENSFFFRMMGGMEKGCMYLVCDFNGIWLKYSNYFCCIVIVLNVEGRVRHVM
jgi:hypothetical protein